MKADLAPEQSDADERGTLTSPDGRVFTRRSTRAKRKGAAELVLSGCLVVVLWPGGLPDRTTLVWHDGPDALSAWEEAKPYVHADEPNPGPGEYLTARRWGTLCSEPLLLLTWHH